MKTIDKIISLFSRHQGILDYDWVEVQKSNLIPMEMPNNETTIYQKDSNRIIVTETYQVTQKNKNRSLQSTSLIITFIPETGLPIIIRILTSYPSNGIMTIGRETKLLTEYTSNQLFNQLTGKPTLDIMLHDIHDALYDLTHNGWVEVDAPIGIWQKGDNVLVIMVIYGTELEYTLNPNQCDSYSFTWDSLDIMLDDDIEAIHKIMIE